MKKITKNTQCPCGSKIEYKKCCKKYHLGARPKSALLLMKSRYSAYAVGDVAYIIQTTHKDNIDYTRDTKKWKSEIKYFCNDTDFKGLRIIDFIELADEAYVEFEASLSSVEMREKSHFIKQDNIWLYESGEILFSTTELTN